MRLFSFWEYPEGIIVNETGLNRNIKVKFCQRMYIKWFEMKPYIFAKFFSNRIFFLPFFFFSKGEVPTD